MWWFKFEENLYRWD